MGSQTTTVLFYIVLWVVTVVAVDVLFFRNQFWERLTVNIGIVFIELADCLARSRDPEEQSRLKEELAIMTFGE